MPDEIEVDSHASANAVNGGNGTGGNTVNSVANTNVKIDMAGLAAKVMEMQSKLGDDDDGPDEISIAINANAGASGSAAGRGFGGFDGTFHFIITLNNIKKIFYDFFISITLRP